MAPWDGAFVAIPRAELRVGGEKVDDWVVVEVTEVVVEAFERVEEARKAARKLAKNGRLVLGMAAGGALQ